MVVLLGPSFSAFLGVCCPSTSVSHCGRRLHVVDGLGIGASQIGDVKAQLDPVHVAELSEGLGRTEHAVQRYPA